MYVLMTISVLEFFYLVQLNPCSQERRGCARDNKPRCLISTSIMACSTRGGGTGESLFPPSLVIPQGLLTISKGPTPSQQQRQPATSLYGSSLPLAPGSSFAIPTSTPATHTHKPGQLRVHSVVRRQEQVQERGRKKKNLAHQSSNGGGRC